MRQDLLTLLAIPIVIVTYFWLACSNTPHARVLEGLLVPQGLPVVNSSGLPVLDSCQAAVDYYWHDIEPILRSLLSDPGLVAQIIDTPDSVVMEGECTVAHFDMTPLLQRMVNYGIPLLDYDEPVPISARLIRQHGTQWFGVSLSLDQQAKPVIDPRKGNEFTVELVVALGPASIWPHTSAVPIDGCESCNCTRTIHLHRVVWECSGFPTGDFWLEYRGTKLRFFLLPGDTNGDGVVNKADMDAVSEHLNTLTNESTCYLDPNLDGKINFSDLIVIRDAMP